VNKLSNKTKRILTAEISEKKLKNIYKNKNKIIIIIINKLN
jgi:hypothetical protein